MFPAFLLPMLIGAGTGALFNKKDPLKGALMGAAGGAIMPGLTNGMGGLFGGTTPAVASPGIGGVLAEQIPAEIIDKSVPAGLFDKFNYGTGGLLGSGMDTLDKFNKVAGPVGIAVNTAQGMIPQEQPMAMPSPPRLNTQAPDLANVLAYGDQTRQFNKSEAARRQQEYNAMVSRMMGLG